MQEIWKDIRGYEGIYQISNLGNVKVLDRKVFNSKCYCVRQGRIFKNNKNGRGYINVRLTKNGKSTNKSVHRLVAEAFITNPNNYKYINHKDENKQNNIVSNLEWCTPKYNQQYSRHKRCRKVKQMDANNNVLNIFESSLEASIFAKVHRSNIIRCCEHKRKTTAGYKWEYT